MTFLPIVERELIVSARLTATYRNRIMTPVLVAILGVAKVLLTRVPATASALGLELFKTLTSLTLLFCLLEGVRKTADCLSGEKREGTLGLLFLTDLKGYDVVLGKLTAGLLTSLYGLFAVLPILAWSLLLGGVTFGEFFRVGLASASVLFFSLAAGIWISSRSVSASRAMAGTLILVVFCLTAPIPILPSPFAPLSPACAFFAASDMNYRGHALEFWMSLLLAQVLSWFLLARASATVNRFRENESRDQAAALEREMKIKSSSVRFFGHRRIREKLLGINPIFWLANRGRRSSITAWLIVMLAALVLSARTWLFPPPYVLRGTSWLNNVDWPLVGFIALVNSLFKVLVGSQSCRFLAEARRNATLEILLCAPLKAEEILQGQIMALKRLLLWPMLILMAVEMAGIYALLSATASLTFGPVIPKEFTDTVIFVEGGFIAFFLVDIQAVVWAGMWFGLCSQNESRATFKTIFYVILLPYVLLVLYCLGSAFFVAWPIVALVWSRLKLQEHFRALAGHRLTSSGEAMGWAPFQIPDQPEEELIELPREASLPSRN